MIFKKVQDFRPYPEHDYSTAQKWSEVAPRKVELKDIITTQKTLDLETLLTEDSTFYGDLFAHIVKWENELYLENGLHRALRSALQQQDFIHARILTLDSDGSPIVPPKQL